MKNKFLYCLAGFLLIFLLLLLAGYILGKLGYVNYYRYEKSDINPFELSPMIQKHVTVIKEVIPLEDSYYDVAIKIKKNYFMISLDDERTVKVGEKVFLKVGNLSNDLFTTNFPSEKFIVTFTKKENRDFEKEVSERLRGYLIHIPIVPRKIYGYSLNLYDATYWDIKKYPPKQAKETQAQKGNK